MQSQEFLEFEFIAKNTQNTNPSLRKEAELSLSRYRTESFLPLLKQILEHSTDPIALFQSSALIRSIITRPLFDRKEWIFYLLEHLKSKELVFHVRNSILQTVAICLKLQLKSKEITELLFNLMAQNPRVGQLLLEALLDEFESKVQSRLGLSIEFHQSAKLDFQKNSLAQVFKLILDQLYSLQSDASGEKMQSLARMVSCSEKVLSWDFITNASLIQNNRNDKRGLTLNQDFNVLLHPQVLHLYFSLVKQYQNSVFPMKLSTCLIQLASLNGQVFTSMQQRYEYLTNYFVLFETHIKCIHADDQFANEKVYECSQIGKNLLKAPIDVLQAIPNFCQVLKLLADLTKMCINLEEYDECLDEYLIMWSLFAELVQQSMDNRQKPGFAEMMEMLNYVCLEVVNVYVESKLSIKEDNYSDDDDYGKDVEVYEDQLLNIATLARLKPVQILSKLLAIMNEKYSQLGYYFQQPAGNDGGVMESLHWLVLMSGFILCDSAYGETPLIPDSILEVSNNNQGEDLVVLLSTKVFEIIGSLTFAKESVQHANCSPLLVETLLWFVERFSSSFLFPDESLYQIKHFGKPSESKIGSSIRNSYQINGGLVLNFILEKLGSYVRIWATEVDIVSQVIQVLSALSKNKTSIDMMLQSQFFSQSITYLLQNITYLPSTTHSPLIQTIAYIATHSSDAALRNTYFEKLAETIKSSLSKIIHSTNFETKFQQNQTREKIICSLEMYNGLCLSIDESTTVPIFETVVSQIENFVKLLDIYRNYPDVELYILTIFKSLIQNYYFDSLSKAHLEILYKGIHQLVFVYCKNEVGRVRAGNLEEDELYDDLCVLLEVLAGLITSAYEGFEYDTVIDRIKNSQFEYDVGGVVFMGMNSLLLLIKPDMLQHPRICMDYMTLVGLLVEYFPDRLKSLPEALLNSLCESLLFGTQSMGRIPGVSYRAIQSLALFGWKRQSVFLSNLLDFLLRESVSSLLLKPLDNSILDTAADCTFALSLARRDTFEAIMQALLNGPNGANVGALVAVVREQHLKQDLRLADIKVGWGAPGLERLPSLNNYRKLFKEFINNSRMKTLIN